MKVSPETDNFLLSIVYKSWLYEYQVFSSVDVKFLILFGYLEENQSEADNQLRLRTDEIRPLCGMLGRFEYPGYPVGLGHQCRITYGKAHANTEHLNATDDVYGFEQKKGRHGVARHDPTQQHVTQFSTSGFDHFGLGILQKDHEDQRGQGDAQAGESQDTDGPVWVDREVGDLDFVTTGLVGVRKPA